jgi:phosphoglycerol transferase MdoB-like AlkP superfamily enzyme
MLKKILFCIIYISCWVVFFELARVYFLMATLSYAKDIPASLVLQSLWYGLKMDLSMSVYISGPVILFTIAGIYISAFRKKKVYWIYTGIVLFFQLLLIIADAEIFKAWGTRIDFTPLKYLANPQELWASVSHLSILWIIVGFIIIYIVLFWMLRKLLSKWMPLLQVQTKVPGQVVSLLLFAGILIIPARGGLQLSPLNQSSVYFCNNQFANSAAVNASWNFMYSLTLLDQLAGNPYSYLNESDAEKIIRPLFYSDAKTEQVVQFADSIKPNVIFIVWESFTQKVMNKFLDGRPVISYFPKLFNEGIYFSNCYSSGDRTDKGISAVLSGYPALPKGSIVNYPEKTARLNGLGTLFLENGYATHFYYGGEPEFANIKSYISAQQFQKVVAKEDFNDEDMNSKWGAHDDVVMKKLLNDITGMKKPFFTTWLTLSSHEPFETPVAPVFNGKDKETRFYNSLHYTDSVIYHFINELKKLPDWKNTLVIISADHGHYLPITGKRADDYRIPMLWLGGALKNRNIRIDKTVSQLDFPLSLVKQLGFSNNSFPFSKNMFDSSSRHWAFFTYNDGIGLVMDSSRVLFDNAGKRLVFEEGKSGSDHTLACKALMQVLYSDFLKR